MINRAPEDLIVIGERNQDGSEAHIELQPKLDGLEEKETRIGGGQWVAMDGLTPVVPLSELSLTALKGAKRKPGETVREIGRYHVDGGPGVGTGGSGRIISTYHLFENGWVTFSEYITGNVQTGVQKKKSVPLSQFIGFGGKIEFVDAPNKPILTFMKGLPSTQQPQG